MLILASQGSGKEAAPRTVPPLATGNPMQACTHCPARGHWSASTTERLYPTLLASASASSRQHRPQPTTTTTPPSTPPPRPRTRHGLLPDPPIDDSNFLPARPCFVKRPRRTSPLGTDCATPRHQHQPTHHTTKTPPTTTQQQLLQRPRHGND